MDAQTSSFRADASNQILAPNGPFDERRSNRWGHLCVMSNKPKPLPSQEVLKEYFDYCPLQGTMRWRKKPNWSIVIGSIAGYFRPENGYWIIRFGKTNYQAHRLIYKWMTGMDLDENEIDHQNNVRHDNRWENLRKSDHFQNMQNKSFSKNNTSTVKGVSWDKNSRKWKSYIMKDRKQIHIGLFTTLEKAQEAIQKKREELHQQFTNHG